MWRRPQLRVWISIECFGCVARVPGLGARDPGSGTREFGIRGSGFETRDQRPGTGDWGLGTAVDRALKALNLVLQAGGFSLVAIDLADVPPVRLRQIPFTTWPRVQRVIEGSDTACVLLTPEPLARSAGGLTLSLAGRSTWAGVSDRSRLLQGVDLRVRVVSPRKRIDGDVRVRAVARRRPGPAFWTRRVSRTRPALRKR